MPEIPLNEGDYSGPDLPVGFEDGENVGAGQCHVDDLKQREIVEAHKSHMKEEMQRLVVLQTQSVGMAQRGGMPYKTSSEAIRAVRELSEEFDATKAQKDAAYTERNKCVALIARMALALGLKAGIGQHEDKEGEDWEDDWRNIIFIDLPSGQISWHIHDSDVSMFAFLPKYDGKWDGHDTEEKYRRVLESGVETSPPCYLVDIENSQEALDLIKKISAESDKPGYVVHLSPREMELFQKMHRVDKFSTTFIEVADPAIVDRLVSVGTPNRVISPIAKAVRLGKISGNLAELNGKDVKEILKLKGAGRAVVYFLQKALRKQGLSLEMGDFWYLEFPKNETADPTPDHADQPASEDSATE